MGCRKARSVSPAARCAQAGAARPTTTVHRRAAPTAFGRPTQKEGCCFRTTGRPFDPRLLSEVPVICAATALSAMLPISRPHSHRSRQLQDYSFQDVDRHRLEFLVLPADAASRQSKSRRWARKLLTVARLFHARVLPRAEIAMAFARVFNKEHCRTANR